MTKRVHQLVDEIADSILEYASIDHQLQKQGQEVEKRYKALDDFLVGTEVFYVAYKRGAMHHDIALFSTRERAELEKQDIDDVVVSYIFDGTRLPQFDHKAIGRIDEFRE